MKRRIYKNYRTRKRGGQYYWVISKRNYAGGPLFGRHLKEKGIKLEGTPKEKRILRRLFERSPELIEENVTIKFEDLPFKIPMPAGRFNTGDRSIKLEKYYLTRPGFLSRIVPPEETLRHETAHSRQFLKNTQPPQYYSPISHSSEDIEKEAQIAGKLPSQRKRKVPEEKINKTFRELISKY